MQTNSWIPGEKYCVVSCPLPRPWPRHVVHCRNFNDFPRPCITHAGLILSLVPIQSTYMIWQWYRGGRVLEPPLVLGNNQCIAISGNINAQGSGPCMHGVSNREKTCDRRWIDCNYTDVLAIKYPWKDFASDYCWNNAFHRTLMALRIILIKAQCSV